MSRFADQWAKARDKIFYHFSDALSFDNPVGGAAITLQAIDRTAGAEIKLSADKAAVIKSLLIVKVEDLQAQGIEGKDLLRCLVMIHGRQWQVRDWQPKPGPGGADSGEILLIMGTPSK
jgi:hypothetical protein